MPELPEVETIRRGLAPVMEGQCFTHVDQRRPDLRFPFPEQFTQRLEGARIEQLNRRAKYILGHLDTGEVLVMHLGMSGRFIIERPGRNAQKPGEFLHKGGETSRHDHIVFTLGNDVRIRYNDARRFGYMMLVTAASLNDHKLFRALGVEPLSDDLNMEFLSDHFSGRKTSLKAALLDQRIIAGLGNIYVCEALHRAGLSPQISAGMLGARSKQARAKAESLVSVIKEVLHEAIEAGGSTLRDYHATDGSLGYFQHSFAVYGRAGLDCTRSECGGTIDRIVQGGRSTFFCPQCQR